MAILLNNSWWMLALVLFASPGAGALVLVQVIGVFALLIGIIWFGWYSPAMHAAGSTTCV